MATWACFEALCHIQIQCVTVQWSVCANLSVSLWENVARSAVERGLMKWVPADYVLKSQMLGMVADRPSLGTLELPACLLL